MSRAQIRTPPHVLVEASFVPSGLKATLDTVQPSLGRTSCCAPVSASNSRTVPSLVRYGDARSVGAEGDCR